LKEIQKEKLIGKQAKIARNSVESKGLLPSFIFAQLSLLGHLF
jgi:hypothetical protein